MTVDHIVYAVQDLETGVAHIEALLGVRPVIGGRHPDFGTHNALLSLGPKTYLEIIAADPDLPIPARGLPFGITSGQQPGIAAWALRTGRIHELATAATAAGMNPGTIQTGTRVQSDGTLLTWALSDPYAMLLDGAIPFLIDWGGTVHPASTATRGGVLTEFRIEHPQADKVRGALSVLGVDIEVRMADNYALTAIIKTNRGNIELK